MEYIIISPHCDDAILSCWYFLEQKDALVITILGDSQFAFNPIYKKHKYFRMAEELSFAIKTKRRLIYYHLPEILTLNEFGAGSESFKSCYRKRTESLKNLSKTLFSINEKAYFLLPLGIGRHPDHTFIRDVFIESSNDLTNFIFYEDQFYRSINNLEEVKHAKSKINFSLKPIDFEINSEQKISTFIEHYPSQIQEEFINAMKNFYMGHNIETYWISESIDPGPIQDILR